MTTSEFLRIVFGSIYFVIAFAVGGSDPMSFGERIIILVAAFAILCVLYFIVDFICRFVEWCKTH